MAFQPNHNKYSKKSMNTEEHEYRLPAEKPTMPGNQTICYVLSEDSSQVDRKKKMLVDGGREIANKVEWPRCSQVTTAMTARYKYGKIIGGVVNSGRDGVWQWVWQCERLLRWL